mmetsp:Transcript_52596/g.147591  ORF Transcript_52596/g.147591 Transcript_52596/m.147591 type:complete len:209 (+) Transcript_52596:693-1319(+)
MAAGPCTLPRVVPRRHREHHHAQRESVRQEGVVVRRLEHLRRPVDHLPPRLLPALAGQGRHGEVDDLNRRPAARVLGQQYVLQGQVPVRDPHVMKHPHSVEDLPHDGLQLSLPLETWRQILRAPREQVAFRREGRDDIGALLVTEDPQQFVRVWEAGPIQLQHDAQVEPRALRRCGVPVPEVPGVLGDPIVGHLLHSDSPTSMQGAIH